MNVIKKRTLAVVLTCYNRKHKTLTCLEGLLSVESEFAQVTVYLVDDGCTDGTSEAVSSQYPEVNILYGTGDLFWNRGMNLAFSAAVSVGYDFYLWVNDDVEFYTGVIDKLIFAYDQLSVHRKDIIISGPTVDRTETIMTYGGFKPQKTIKPYDVRKISRITEEYQPLLIFHGNCVLIPHIVVQKIGVNDPYYQHAFGDNDYSLMAAKAGCKAFLANFSVGICERHDDSFVFLDESVPIKKRLESLHSKMNQPKTDLKHYCKKFFGIWWPYKYWSADIRIVISGVRYKIMHLTGGRN